MLCVGNRGQGCVLGVNGGGGEEVYVCKRKERGGQEVRGQ